MEGQIICRLTNHCQFVEGQIICQMTNHLSKDKFLEPEDKSLQVGLGRVPRYLRVEYTNYLGKNLLPVTRMLIIECINKKNSKQIEASST